MAGYALGVDLGTTNTSAAVFRDGSAEPVPLGARSALVPTVVLLKVDGSLLFGDAAERRAAHEPNRVAREFKRRVGDDVPILIAGSPFSAQNLMALMLRWVLERVIELQGGAPDRMVVSHPANWSRYRRECLADAIRAMGLTNFEMLAEPQAAALHFASGSRLPTGQTIAVYDLGGGTFDAAVLAKEDAGFRLVGEPQGIDSLGGIDFDDAMLGQVRQFLATQQDGSDPVNAEDLDQAGALQLRREVIEAKESLSQDTDMLIDLSIAGRRQSMVMRRSEFEELIKPQVQLTVACLARTVSVAHLDEPVSAIVLVGGSARIPLVSELITAELRRPVLLASQPQLAVALGAAIGAAAGQQNGAGSAPAPGAGPSRPVEPVLPARSDRVTEDGPRHRAALLTAGIVAAAVILVVAIVVLGGRKAKTPTAAVTRLTTPAPASTGSPSPVIHPTAWTPMPPVRVSFEGGGAVAFHNQLWVIGGNGKGQPLDAVQVFDPAFGSWHAGPKLLALVGEAGVVTDGRSIYVIGGSPVAGSSNPVSTVYRLDSPTGSWQRAPSLLEPRISGAAAFDGTRIVYAGGFGPGGRSSTDVFAFQDGRWQKIADLPDARDNFAAASDGHGVTWFFGGTGASLNTIVRLQGRSAIVVERRLATGSRATTAVGWPGVGACMLAGASYAESHATCVSAPSGAWLPPAPRPSRGGAAAAVVGDHVYIVGGFGAGIGTDSRLSQAITVK